MLRKKKKFKIRKKKFRSKINKFKYNKSKKLKILLRKKNINKNVVKLYFILRKTKYKKSKKQLKKKIYFSIHFKKKNIFFNIQNANKKIKKVVTLGKLGFLKAKKRSFFSVIEMSFLLRFFFFNAVKQKKKIFLITKGGKKKKKVIFKKILNKYYLRSCFNYLHLNKKAHNGTKKKKKPRK